jgi:hypothetical protein
VSSTGLVEGTGVQLIVIAIILPRRSISNASMDRQAVDEETTVNDNQLQVIGSLLPLFK